MTKSSTKKPRERLQEYREKRDPTRTNEPFAPERTDSGRQTRSGRFVVHLHDATRKHYDLRLQVGSALKSFAVPKGPSLDPREKRLAVNTEDHPLEYLEFEAVIPEGSYGAGPMIAWDMGRVSYLETSAEEGIERSKIDFELAGFKLKGRFALVHTGARRPGSDEEKQWLLFKKGDAYATTENDVLRDKPRSVLSGLLIEELGRREELSREIERRADELGAPLREIGAARLTPMLALADAGGLGDADRIYELKLDGVRIVAEKNGDSVALRYRNGNPATISYPEVGRAVRALAVDRCVIDGEIVTFDPTGRPSFQRLGPRIQARRPLDVARVQAQIPVVFVVFDVLSVGGRDLTGLPLMSRKELLARIVPGSGFLRVLDHIEGDGRALFDFCKRQRLEGVVGKRQSSPYRSGPNRTSDWIKVKCERDDDFIVFGWSEGKNARERLGALCLASYRGDELVYRGRAGSGLDEGTIDQLLGLLHEIEVPTSPVKGELPAESARGHFVEPRLVAQVRYLGFSDDGHLREPVFLGLRPDVDPRNCTAGPPAEPPGAEESIEAAVRAQNASERQRIPITNRSKVFWPEDGYTKGDLCDYYAAVAPAMLPYLDGRPIVLVRHPDGILGKNFFQWHVPAGTPDWIRRLQIRDPEDQAHKGPKTVFLVDSVDGLVHVANLGCIPIHVLAARERSLDECDFLTIDLDIGERPFADAVTLALGLKALLDEIGLAGYPKTSGQKGLHVLVPLGSGVSFDSAKLLVELLGRLLTARHPEIATMERRVSKRGPKVFVDVGQTGHSRTIVAPYSVRAVRGATVSTPLAWSEVHAGLDPARFNLATVPTRVAELGDPMRGFLDQRPDIRAALERISPKLA